ncbi:metal-dependent hydrolase [Caballeronia sp. LP006]|uniref:metal-dependent hydrolase n=1 Tax=Caballeronia sp. LP006 TaxID=3038552 RepID=UPI002861FEAE|nr:metal-dependent hydrolase [Caballeronia sp. LP006]MDR5828372.1 metal-dependent hydrolase [Caballeronia sp. LP006]
MASSKAHHATGWAAGIIAAAIVGHMGNIGSAQGIDKTSGGMYYLYLALALLAGVAGATAPDWLEVAWWSKRRKLWITHRTLTHWGIGWGALLALSWHLLREHPAAAVGFGFACGGIMHLLADWPNPLGVPWIGPRHSLNLWTSGTCDLIVVGLSWVAAFYVVDDLWFHHAHVRMLLNAVHVLTGPA